MRDRHLIYGMLFCLLGFVLVIIYGCEKEFTGVKTPLGIPVYGDFIPDDMVDKLDRGFLASLDCWEEEVDGDWKRFRPGPEWVVAFIEDVSPAYASGRSIVVSPYAKYRTVRHEWSHVVSLFATGQTVHNRDGRCWL